VELPADAEVAEPVYTVVPRGFHADPYAGPIAKPYQITLSSGIYLLQPTFQSDPALIVTRAGSAQTQQLDFNRHLVAAPAVWLGLVGDHGWGVRMRYYTLDQDAGLIAASVPGESLSAASPFKIVQTPVFGSAQATGQLHIDSWDGEGTCNWERSKWAFLLGSGVRYVHLNQNYSASVFDFAGNQNVALASHNFNGVGPTFSFQGKRPICDSCISAYGIMHMSVLFGSSDDDYSASAANGPTQSVTRHEVSVLPIGEIEVGAEYSRCVRHCRLFFQTGFVGQVWWGAGSASNFDAVNNAASANSNFGFVGLALRAGLTF
jgi:hypothetical protein